MHLYFLLATTLLYTTIIIGEYGLLRIQLGACAYNKKKFKSAVHMYMLHHSSYKPMPHPSTVVTKEVCEETIHSIVLFMFQKKPPQHV